MYGNKYKNVKTEVDGIKFDSRKEAKYYKKLQLLLQAGEISNLELQVSYTLLPALYEDEVIQLKTKTKIKKRCVQRAVTYVADFRYIDNKTGDTVVVDTKGVRTKEYLLKRKMMRSLLGIIITEV